MCCNPQLEVKTHPISYINLIHDGIRNFNNLCNTVASNISAPLPLARHSHRHAFFSLSRSPFCLFPPRSICPPQLHTIETTITTILTARDEPITTIYTPATTLKPLDPRGNYLESELAEIQSKIIKTCSPVTTSSGWRVYDCDNAVISSLEANIKQFYDTTTGTKTKFSTVTVVPIKATRARGRNVSILGNALSTLEGPSSLVNLGSVLPSSTPTPGHTSPDITLSIPQAVTQVVAATATALQYRTPLASGNSVRDGSQE
ncbi:hypothetical protein DID88_009313 [Monilinia fructigena]|uniref:Uncharacterized protein n=1 Tax=Monilinia fructigena TaxID=38457 RepID=A0A395IHS0_9HELO|nr:hypothetical protein DID88_009313 [Monilinia fructigena]